MVVENKNFDARVHRGLAPPVRMHGQEDREWRGSCFLTAETFQEVN
jgi:hypothetical protein